MEPTNHRRRARCVTNERGWLGIKTNMKVLQEVEWRNQRWGYSAPVITCMATASVMLGRYDWRPHYFSSDCSQWITCGSQILKHNRARQRVGRSKPSSLSTHLENNSAYIIGSAWIWHSPKPTLWESRLPSPLLPVLSGHGMEGTPPPSRTGLKTNLYFGNLVTNEVSWKNQEMLNKNINNLLNLRLQSSLFPLTEHILYPLMGINGHSK